MEALLERFHGFASSPLFGDVADPAAGGAGEGVATRDGAPSAGDGGAQG